VIANISVEPVSPMDDGLRLRAARAIYGDSCSADTPSTRAADRIIVDNVTSRLRFGG